ncbi:hypothetical protein C8R48DRAFT_780445 [Suillus tomentosus]|nr:hypothetical protein C8R48DRAFT_780445 [Suillus tomentosus]
MSSLSSPSSAYSTLEPPEFKADPEVVSMLVQILTTRHGILHYHGETGELATYQWPTDRHGRKIHPSQFEAYRETHAFRYPSCLCSRDGNYVEASVFERTQGICRGEYIAECATSTCAYMLNVEKFFEKAYVPAVYYPRKWYSCYIFLLLLGNSYFEKIITVFLTIVQNDVAHNATCVISIRR